MGANRVGQRIHVYWTDETAWFSGVVRQFDAAQGYYVVYDDGDERWEGLNESYRFEGQQSSDDENSDHEESEGAAADGEEHEVSGAGRAATPRAIEPPSSDTEGDSDREEGESRSASYAQAKEFDADTTRVDDNSGDSTPVQSASYPLPVVLRGSDADTESEDGQDEGDDRSVTSTEVPITHEPVHNARQPSSVAMTPGQLRRLLPHRGVLRGYVKYATNLPLVNKHDEPRAFVRIAFVENNVSGEAARRQTNMLMLRCKRVLSVTRAAPASSHPMWNDADDCSSERREEENSPDGRFQLHVVPPMSVHNGTELPQPAWLQLRGELLFSVYHQEQADGRFTEFIGQASLPLCQLMRQLLNNSSTDPVSTATQSASLETRQGKPLRSTNGDSELLVELQFEPEFEPDCRAHKAKDEIRPTVTARTKEARPSTSSLASSRVRPTSATSAVAAKPRCRRHHQSSSEINRRKFEKQLEIENKAMAKRVAEQRRETGASATRRQQLNHQPRLIKSEPKPGVVAVTTAPRRSHKSSSEINRAKFVDHVKQENLSMGKRLIERVGLLDPALRRTDGDRKVELDWGDAKAQDKAHVVDKRHVLRQEKDFLLEKAQAKYQEQNGLVEDVMALQTQVAELRSKLFALRSNIQRIDAMNTKDSHVRDCLLRATEKSKRPVSDSRVSTSTCVEQLLALDDDQDDVDLNSALQKHRGDVRTLLHEASLLESERQRLEEQTANLGSQETKLEEDILELHRRWQFVETKRAFQTKMAARGTPASAAYASQELTAKQTMMEMSSEEEEQYEIYKAQIELMQLQIATTVLRDRIEAKGPAMRLRDGSSSVACDCFREKIEKRRSKVKSLEAEQEKFRRQYEDLVANGEYENLRARVQELQHLLFLCQSEAKHVAFAERVAKQSKGKLEVELQKQRFDEQTETDILLKRSRKPSPR